MSDEPEETSYYLRLLSMYMDLGTEIVLDVLLYHTPGHDAERFLRSKQGEIIQMKNSHILNEQECSMLLQQGRDVVKYRLDIKSFDISLIITLTQNLFTAHELPPPIKGWNNPPRNIDKSIAADLLRLKKIRNIILGHHPRARLPFWRFEAEWDDVSEILLRLQQQIAPGKVAHLQARIEAYRLQHLEATVKHKYDGKPKEWHQEVAQVQDKVEEMIKKLGETEQNRKVEQEARDIPNEFENDPYYLQLYIDAISEGDEKDRVTRVNVVGNFFQGKTTLIKRLTNKTIEGVESTNSVEINHCTCKSTDGKVDFIENEHAHDQFDDTGRLVRVAQEKQEKRNHQHDIPLQKETQSLITSPVSVRKTDLDNDGKTEEKNSKLQLKDKSEETIERTEEANRPKSKREHNRIEISHVSHDNQKKFADHYKNKKDIDTNQNDLEIWDFGGQFSFYATHSLFHSMRALYLLVFDLSIPLSERFGERVKDSEFRDRNDEMTMAEYAQFWLNSIHAYVGSEDGNEPPVILVGTHKDELKGDVDDAIEKYFAEIKELFVDEKTKRHIQPKYFAVDNTNENDNTILELRKEIVDKGEKMATIRIPARWIHLEKSLRLKRQAKIIKFEDLMIIDSKNEVPLKEEKQVKLFLRYHHSKGTLLYFDEEPISAYVVLDPQYVIDAFKCFITSKRFATPELLNRLTETGLLEDDIIDSRWNKENGFCEHKQELLMFLEKHLIISKVWKYDENAQKSSDKGEYLVPSFLPSNSTEAALTSFLKDRQQTSVRFVMSFKQPSVVQHVYYRLLAALIGKWEIVEIPVAQKPVKKMKRFIYKNKGVFQLDINHAGIVEYLNNEIDLRVVSLSSSTKVDSKCADELRRFSESIVENEFMKFRNPVTQKDKPYKLCFRCNNNKHGPEGGIRSNSFPKVDDKRKIPCPDYKQHEDLDVAQIYSEWFMGDKIDVSFSDRQIEDIELSEMVNAIGKGWYFLGLKLGFTTARLDQIKEDHPKNAQMKRYAMLLEWKRKEKHEATIKALIRAMKTEPKVHIEWENILKFVDKIKKD